VKVDAQLRAAERHALHSWRENRRDVGVILEHGCETLLDDHADLKIRPARFQDVNGRRSENAITERSQTYYDNVRALPDTVEDIGHRMELLFDPGLIDQHDRYVIPDRVYPLALRTLQPALVGLQVEGRFAKGTHEDLEKFLAEGHS
jgi:hypothetical protein